MKVPDSSETSCSKRNRSSRFFCANRRRRRLVQKNLEERLRFEQLVSELSGTFINLPPEKVEGQIHRALGQVINFLKFDIGALSLFADQGTEARVAYVCK